MLPYVHQTTGDPVVTMNDMKITWEVGNHGGSFSFPSLSLVLHWARTLTNLLLIAKLFFLLNCHRRRMLFINQRKLTLSQTPNQIFEGQEFVHDSDREPEISDEENEEQGRAILDSASSTISRRGEPASQAPISCRNISSSLWIQEEHWMYRRMEAVRAIDTRIC